MKTIPVSQGRIAVVDDEDFDRVSQNSWSLKKSPHDKTEYASRSIKINGKWTQISLHRFVFNARPGVRIDHKDGNGLNCQKFNLRECSHPQNLQNQRMHNKHGLKGIALITNLPAHRQWISKIRVDGKLKTIGHFGSALEAAAAYNAMATKHFGEFARLNPI